MNTRILATLATAGALLSSANITAQELEVTATAGVESEYVFRGIEIAGESFQGSVELNYADAYFGVWTNEAFEDEYSDTSEYDIYGGWAYAINDTFTADIGATVYYYPDAVGDDDTFEAYLGFSADTLLAPSLYVFYDFDLEVLTFEGSISKSLPLAEKTSLDLGGAIGYADADEGEDYAYYTVTADIVYSFQPNMNASIGVRAAGNDNNMGPGGREHNAWAGASFSYGF